MRPEFDLPIGAYEALLTQRLSAQLAANSQQAHVESLDPAETAMRIAAHLSEAILVALEALPAKDRTQAQVAMINEVLDGIAEQQADGISDLKIVVPPKLLRQLTPRLLPGENPPELPSVPLVDHDLLTNAPGEPSLAHALQTELATASRLDGVIAFIRWTGLRHLCGAIEELRKSGKPVRVLTTTFTGSTERRALDWLVAAGAEVKVSYDTRTTRLHAKSWLVHRDTGYSTAYVGSSNLSHAALINGIEWNVRIAQKTAPAVFHKLCATFDSLWNDDSFEGYDQERDAQRFDAAVHATRSGTSSTALSGLEVRPWHYQRQILEALVRERARGKRTRNLVVAPTGTGKTVVAALDYRALCAGDGGADIPKDASLLFVAHREQILEQSLRTFRDVLQRGDFGELLVGGSRPQHWRHVFASIQSLSKLDLDQLTKERFDVVYVDEFHHAEAATYQRLIDHLAPSVLVGMTATPERADGVDIRQRYFTGRCAFEMRLWDALDQQLLAPFHYFGVADGTDLSNLRWQRGGYRSSDLEAHYVIRDGNDARTTKVLAALRERVTDTSAMRAIGFCVSVAHAHYMAEQFRRAGISAAAIDAATSSETRAEILRSLGAGEINAVFAVDVLTEGVDIPQVDTILLLRPTESATVFLQQLGRGLRMHRDKDVCTVLDFIGQQHRRFRFDLRLRAMTGRSRGELLRDTKAEFPLLPSGCMVQLDRQAEQHILENLKAATNAPAKMMARELAELEAQRGRLTLTEYLAETLHEPDDVYRGAHTWTSLRRLADLDCAPCGPRDDELLAGIRLRLQDVDDPERIDMLRTLSRGDDIPGDPRSQRLATMLGYVLFADGQAPPSLAAVQAALRAEPAVRRELGELADVLEDRAATLTAPDEHWDDVPLHVHATYTKGEVLAALGARRLGQKTALREGVKYVAERNADLLFVTLHKSERHYSPTTRYRDYAISRELFHWESQSGTTRRSPTGQRYLGNDSRVMLFVRQQQKDARSRTMGFMYLGPATRVSDHGERPIEIDWRLATPMPETMLRLARAVAI